VVVEKLLLSMLGVGIAAVGAALWSDLGLRLTQGLNALYRQLPGRFQYSTSFHRFIGGFFVVFGLLIAVLIWFAHPATAK
jgi:hypothetical protein